MDYVFFTFFWNATSKKRKKSRFFGFSKKRKKRILELCLRSCYVKLWLIDWLIGWLHTFAVCSVVMRFTVAMISLRTGYLTASMFTRRRRLETIMISCMHTQRWKWVIFRDPWPMWPITQLTHDPHDLWPMAITLFHPAHGIGGSVTWWYWTTLSVLGANKIVDYDDGTNRVSEQFLNVN